MAIERTYYCEGPDCNGHCRTATPPPHLPPGFLEVREGGDGTSEPLHFCAWDCVLKYAAKVPPTETIPFGPSGEGESVE